MAQTSDGQTRADDRRADELGEQSIYEEATEFKRRMRRGDESVGDADARDVAGIVPVGETPQGRAERDTVVQEAGALPVREPTEGKARSKTGHPTGQST